MYFFLQATSAYPEVFQTLIDESTGLHVLVSKWKRKRFPGELNLLCIAYVLNLWTSYRSYVNYNVCLKLTAIKPNQTGAHKFKTLQFSHPDPWEDPKSRTPPFWTLIPL